MTQQLAAEPLTENEAQLYRLVDQLLEFYPAVIRYRQLENLVTGHMLVLNMEEVAVPGRFQVRREGETLIVTPPDPGPGTLFEIPARWLALMS